MNFNLLAKLAAVDKVSGTEQAAVVVTGLAVVFSVLIILVLFVLLFGKIMNKPKNSDSGSGNAPAAVKAQPAEKKNSPIASVSGGAAAASADDDEIIAVISAVIAQMSAEDGKTYKIKSVRQRQNKSCGRPIWAVEGLRQNTSPF